MPEQKQEKSYEKLVSSHFKWADQTQGCHDLPKNKEHMPAIDVDSSSLHSSLNLLRITPPARALVVLSMHQNPMLHMGMSENGVYPYTIVHPKKMFNGKHADRP